jgi:5S rRNA maturation endonuclease (ribonuclease M5)
MNSNVQDILNRLEKVKSTTDNQWTACCPAHEDKKPSLSINLADDGKVLVYCHAGCSHKDVVSAMGLTVKDLFAPSSAAPAKKNSIVRAAYDYRDFKGDLAYQILKKSDGTFSYRRPDANGEWIYQVGDTPKILYRLPELLAADNDQIIFIPEGEKDVDSLTQLGLVATCNPFGGTKWAVLEGNDCPLYERNVVILPDHDQVGNDHAAKVARHLYGHCRKIQILELPGLSHKQDVSDWIDQQKSKTPDQIAAILMEMAENATVWSEDFTFSVDFDKESVKETVKVTPSIEWPAPQPIPDQMPVVMPFDTTLLPANLQPWIDDVADRMQCPVDFPAVTAMLALAALVGRKLAIRPKRQDNWTVIPNLWGMLVGRPSIMKTPPMKEILKPLNRLAAEACEDYEKRDAQYESEKLMLEMKEKAIISDITKALRKGESTEELEKKLAELPKLQVPVRRRYTVNDVTVEALGQVLAQNPYGVLQERDELMGFLKSLERKGQDGSRAFYLEAWNGNGHFETDRIGRGNIRINGGLCLSMIGTIQPGPLESYIHEAVSGGSGDDGFIQRFQLSVWPDDPQDWQIVDRWPDKDAQQLAWEVFQNLDRIDANDYDTQFDPFDQNAVPYLRFDSSAQEKFYDWMRFNENRLRSGEEHPALESHFAKYRSMVPSLALLIHLADKETGAVGSEAITKALGWEKYLVSHARRIYGRGLDPEIWHAQALAEKILAGQVTDGFVVRDVYKKSWHMLTSKPQVLIAVEYLEELDWLHPETIETGGRPKISYRINPRVFNV